MAEHSWSAVRRPLTPRQDRLLVVLSFVLPLLSWSVLSYVPFLWHPFVEIESPGSVGYFTTGMRIEKETFAAENAKAAAAGAALATGSPKNPIYLPAPHEVARALITAFRTPPR